MPDAASGEMEMCSIWNHGIFDWRFRTMANDETLSGFARHKRAPMEHSCSSPPKMWSCIRPNVVADSKPNGETNPQ